MNNLIRIIVATLISLTFSVGVFASSGTMLSTSTTLSGSSERIIPSTSDDQEEDELAEEKKEKIKQEITSYIIDSYKAQGDKILKDIDQTLQKTVPQKTDRVEAYKKIRASLEARRIKNNRLVKTSDTSKIIVNEFLTHMIVSIDKRIEELSK